MFYDIAAAKEVLTDPGVCAGEVHQMGHRSPLLLCGPSLCTLD